MKLDELERLKAAADVAWDTWVEKWESEPSWSETEARESAAWKAMDAAYAAWEAAWKAKEKAANQN